MCVCLALFIQHAMRMRHIVICDLSGSTILFHIIWQTARFSKKKVFETKCVFWFSLQFLSETFLILRRIERDMIKTVYWSAATPPSQLQRCILTDYFNSYNFSKLK